ncbi:MAG: RipA family octameric membrane protein [Pseudomonadales bacterium]
MPESEYGTNYRADYLRMYQDYVASADKISERRHGANTYFLAINTTLLGVTGYLQGDPERLLWLAALAGVVFSYTWRRLIASYKSLNSAKFDVIQVMEQQLPLAPYYAEWKQLQRDKHVSFSAVESWVPLAFMVMHGIVCVVNLYSWFSSLGS